MVTNITLLQRIRPNHKPNSNIHHSNNNNTKPSSQTEKHQHHHQHQQQQKKNICQYDNLQQKSYEDRIAVIDPRSKVKKTYFELNEDIQSLVQILSSFQTSWNSERVLNLMPSGYGWILTQLSLWTLGSINVPQPNQNPLPEIKRVIRLAKIRIGICSDESVSLLESVGLDLVIVLSNDGLNLISSKSNSMNKKLVQTNNKSSMNNLNFSINNCKNQSIGSGGALMLFTSGTTGVPKGVLITHSAISHQCSSLGEVWNWNSDDRILHNLPLTHIHGIINALALPLWYHSTIEFSPTSNFSPADFWSRFFTVDESPITVFTGVPTMYSKLIQYHRNKLNHLNPRITKKFCEKVRVMISGSAALSSRIRKDWYDLTGHVLLERYGMTETGMILSNKIFGERLEGHVGYPLNGVNVRLRDQMTGEIIEEEEDEIEGFERVGEIEVKSRSLFDGYWSFDEQRPVRDSSFTSDGFFKTGDIAKRSLMRGEGGERSYKILGRISTDIIKTGGEKISAREIEEEILKIEGIKEAIVLGIPDLEWGEIVGCVLILENQNEIDGDHDDVRLDEGGSRRLVGVLNNKNGKSLKRFEEDELKEVNNLRKILRDRISVYKLPKILKVYKNDDYLPKNVMGKVQKVKLAKLAFPEKFQ